MPIYRIFSCHFILVYFIWKEILEPGWNCQKRLCRLCRKNGFVKNHRDAHYLIITDFSSLKFTFIKNIKLNSIFRRPKIPKFEYFVQYKTEYLDVLVGNWPRPIASSNRKRLRRGKRLRLVARLVSHKTRKYWTVNVKEMFITQGFLLS